MKRKYIGWAAIIAALVIILIYVGYQIDATGFNGYHTVTTATSHSGTSSMTVTRTEVEVPGKTLWDWLQLLGVPVALAVVAYLFNRSTSSAEQANTQKRYENDQALAADKQREDLLQTYLDRMSELLLTHNLRSSKAEDEVRYIARARTLTTLSQLDAKRKGKVLQFLQEGELIHVNESIIDLDGADLSYADLRDARLHDANLNGANLRGADLSSGELYHANLTYADLSGANLRNVHLDEANLREAKLGGADLSDAYLRGKTDLSYADLSGANLSDADLKLVNLQGAKLNGAKLVETYFRSANLRNADLTDADLREAILWDANLSRTIFQRADLRGAELVEGDGVSGEADMDGANLSEANLEGAKITQKQLNQAKSLKGATMPDGTKHS